MTRTHANPPALRPYLVDDAATSHLHLIGTPGTTSRQSNRKTVKVRTLGRWSRRQKEGRSAF